MMFSYEFLRFLNSIIVMMTDAASFFSVMILYGFYFHVIRRRGFACVMDRRGFAYC